MGLIDLKTIERTCAFCERTFVQDFADTLKCICPNCKQKAIVPETIEEHIKEESKKSPEFKEAYEKEEKRLERKEAKKDGTDNRNPRKPGEGL